MTSDPRLRLLTARQAAALIGVEPATIRRWVARGYLTPWPMPGRAHLFREIDVLVAERDTRRRGGKHGGQRG